jgi:hypothetical protein
MIPTEPVRKISVSWVMGEPISSYWIAGFVRGLAWAATFSIAYAIGFWAFVR